MTDQFREEVVTKKNRAVQTAAYLAVNLMWILLAVYAFLAFQNLTLSFSAGGLGTHLLIPLLQLLIPGGLAVLLFLNKDKARTEYEYTFTNGQMDFAEVYNNKKRKNLGTMNIRNVEACGLVASGSFQRYLNMQNVKRTNWFLNRDAELLYFFFQKDGQKRMIIIEPSEEMTQLIKKNLSQGVWQIN